MSNTDFNPETTAEQMDDENLQTEAAGIRPAGYAAGLAQQQNRQALEQQKVVPVVGADDYRALIPGQKYRDPEGNIRVRRVENETDYERIPEGSSYPDPDDPTGQTLRQKPKYEGVGLKAQTLYDMTINPKEKQRVLEQHYPGKVRQDYKGEFIVDDYGVLRKPGHGAERLAGAGASMAGPTIGGGIGALGGGVLGAVGGGVAGQGLNDLIVHWSGNSDRSLGEEALNLGVAGGAGAVGYGVGKVAGAVSPMLSNAGKSAKDLGPIAAANVLGAGSEVTAARKIAEATEKPSTNALLNKLGITESDTFVGPSAWAHEAPYVQMLDEVYYPKFFTNQPHVKAAEENYRRGVGEITGREVGSVDDLLRPTEAVPTRQAGDLLRGRAAVEQGDLETRLEQTLNQREAELRAGIPDVQKSTNEAQNILRQQRDAAQRIIDQRLAAVEPEVNQAIQAAAGGTNPGQFWGAVGGRLQEARREVGQEASRQYNAAYRLAGGNRINAQPLSEAAIDFLEQAPQEMREAVNHPMIRRLRAIAGEQDAGGNWATNRTPLSLEEVQDIRSWMRDLANYDTLSSDFKNGAVKYFARQADDLIQGAGRTPQFRPAVEALNSADEWYRQNIRAFNSTEMKATIGGLRAGQPADPEQLFKVLVKPNNTAMIGELERVVGPNLWNGVRAAQRQRWVTNAREGDFADRVDAMKYAKEVLEAHQDGTLRAVQGPENAQRMYREAQQIAVLNGKLDVAAAPGDTSFDIFKRARQAQLELDQFAKQDPVGLAQKEIDKALTQQRSANQSTLARKDDPLGFVYDPTYGAQKAVDHILKSDDLILAAAARWGENSPEFEGLRRIYVDRLFRDSMNLGGKLGEIKPEVQSLMLPGVKLDTAKRVADEMALMMKANSGNDIGGSFSGTSKVTNPIGGGVVGRTVQKLPGSATLGRKARADYYNFMHKLITSPATLRYVERGLMGRDPAELQRARDIISASIQKGKTMGAAAAEGANQEIEDERAPANVPAR